MGFLGSIARGTVVTSETIVMLDTSFVSVLQVNLNVTALSGTAPSLQPYLEVLGEDNAWYPVWKPTALTAVGPVTAAVGPGCGFSAVFAAVARLRFEVTGTTPSFVLSLSVNGR